MPGRNKIPIGVLALAISLPMLGLGAPLRVGERAPNFTLPDQNGQEISLGQFLGKKNVVLAFYVLAFTGG
jgi:cytochrome oxidase Cu insertion factor (SCO1/SenC/PrrC family)